MSFKAIEMGGESTQVDDIVAALKMPGFKQVADRLMDGLIILDGDGQVLAINSPALAINKIPPGDAGALSPDAIRPVIERIDPSPKPVHGGRRDFVAMTDDGRSILTSLRYWRDGRLDLTLIFQRDLQVFDHLRRAASGQGESNVFKFLSDRETGPDYAAQRRLSPDVDAMVTRGLRALQQGARLLLLGESGSGKTELAKYLHRTAGTREEAFIHVNCGAVPESLFESEMFGYEKGAFTGALQSGKQGLIEAAEGGTLFLDEIGEIPLHSQAKLLKFLEDGMVQRLGARRGKKVNTRIISATNRDLWQQVQEGHFRRDLYYRLAVITLEVASLRHQCGLVDHLVDHFLGAANKMRRPRLAIDPACRERIRDYAFPGNIRELHNLIQHLSVVADDIAGLRDLPPHIRNAKGACEEGLDARKVKGERETDETTTALKARVRAYERDLIEAAIVRFGSKRKAARALGIDIGTVVRKTRPPNSKPETGENPPTV